MKNSKQETWYTITLSNGKKITATASMLYLMCIAYNECAERHIELGLEAIAKEQLRIATEIHTYLEDKGYYDD